mmetsp:Transcript_102978/g.266285  ORF Transcript_102978/g.266285 Transcript_102978/m.266285 type:complete len:97 (-) Transcript_102978:175-465(-)
MRVASSTYGCAAPALASCSERRKPLDLHPAAIDAKVDKEPECEEVPGVLSGLPAAVDEQLACEMLERRPLRRPCGEPSPAKPLRAEARVLADARGD